MDSRRKGQKLTDYSAISRPVAQPSACTITQGVAHPSRFLRRVGSTLLAQWELALHSASARSKIRPEIVSQNRCHDRADQLLVLLAGVPHRAPGIFVHAQTFATKA